MGSCSVSVLELQSVIAQSSCEAENIAATAATSETKYIQLCSLLVVGVSSKRSLDVRFLWLQAETAAKRVRNSRVPGPENAADANSKLADRRSRVLSIEHVCHADPETVSASISCLCLSLMRDSHQVL